MNKMMRNAIWGLGGAVALAGTNFSLSAMRPKILDFQGAVAIQRAAREVADDYNSVKYPEKYNLDFSEPTHFRVESDRVTIEPILITTRVVSEGADPTKIEEGHITGRFYLISQNGREIKVLITNPDLEVGTGNSETTTMINTAMRLSTPSSNAQPYEGSRTIQHDSSGETKISTWNTTTFNGRIQVMPNINRGMSKIGGHYSGDQITYASAEMEAKFKNDPLFDGSSRAGVICVIESIETEQHKKETAAATGTL